MGNLLHQCACHEAAAAPAVWSCALLGHVVCQSHSIPAPCPPQVPGSGQITNVHITDYSIEGAVPLPELCPLASLRGAKLPSRRAGSALHQKLVWVWRLLVHLGGVQGPPGYAPRPAVGSPTLRLYPLQPRASAEFDVDGGRLTGPIPTGFAQCFPELIELDLSYNSLTGGGQLQLEASCWPTLPGVLHWPLLHEGRTE